jgi:transcriptional regulator with XRE-family HTH domain
MLVITREFNEKLLAKNLSQRALAKMIDYSDSGLNARILGKYPFSKSIIKKLLPILEVTKNEFESWIVADKYPKKLIEKAIEAIKNREDKKVLVFTQNIDKILKEKNLSRTALAKAIKYDQPSVNNMITGKKSISKTVLTGISGFLEIPEEDLQAWILADKYSLKVLELALKIN